MAPYISPKVRIRDRELRVDFGGALEEWNCGFLSPVAGRNPLDTVL